VNKLFEKIADWIDEFSLYDSKEKVAVILLILLLSLNSFIITGAIVRVTENIPSQVTVDLDEPEPVYSLMRFPSFLDWGAYTSISQSKNKSVDITNNGDQTLYVFWTTDLEGLSAGPGFDLTAKLGENDWPSESKVLFDPDDFKTADFNLTLTNDIPDSQYSFMIQIHGDDSN